jgi:hypothetical protein
MESKMPSTFTQIGSTVNVGSGGTSTINFTDIPSTYTDLCLMGSIRTGTSTSLRIGLNGSAANFSSRTLEGSGSGTPYAGISPQSGQFFLFNVTDTSNAFSNFELYFSNYAGSTQKTFSTFAVGESNIATVYMTSIAHLWNETSAISAINLSLSSDTMVQHSSVSLYGIKNL